MGICDSKQTIYFKDLICEEAEERAVDVNVVLPDYFPPVAAVLKCSMLPVITNRSQSNDRFSVDGTTTIRVLYVSDDRENVHCYETTQPFNVGFHCENAVFHNTSVNTEYVNCRTVAPRRLDIHGCFKIGFKAIGKKECTLFKDPCSDGFYCKGNTIQSSVPLREVEKAMSINETIDIGRKHADMVYSDAMIVSEDCKVLTNKMIAKGILRIKCGYMDEGEYFTLTEDIPFSQIIDIDGVRDDRSCLIDMMIGDHDTYIQQVDTGGALLCVNCRILLCAKCSETVNESVVTDAYSLSFPLLCERETVCSDSIESVQKETVHVSRDTDAPEKLSELLDAWGEMKSYDVIHGNNENKVQCCINVCFFGKEDDGQIGYYERVVDLSIPLNKDWQSCTVRLVELQCLQVANALHVQAEAELVNTTEISEALDVISTVVMDEDNPYSKHTASLRIVYAEKGDSVWEIAKKHHSSADSILTENGLKHDLIDNKTMLVIPLA